jgi:protoheme IX farnesyltransferase
VCGEGLAMSSHPVLASNVAIVQRRPFVDSTVVSDYCAMTKPDVNCLIAITTATAFYIGSPEAVSVFPWIRLLHTLIGTVLVASGAATLNQWMEHRFDARMRRTARRPVAAGRIDPISARRFGTALSFSGIAYLAVAAGPLASGLAAVTLLSYLFRYTPLKRLTPLCTLIGAFPGAVPPLIGWAAARGRLDSEAWVLYAMVFLWQFPHFMAIAWMYRDDYDRAGYLVLPRGHARARFVTLQTLLPLLALLALSLFPVLAGEPSLFYVIGAMSLGLCFLWYGVQLTLRRSGSAARRLLLASIVYLPSLFVLMVLNASR